MAKNMVITMILFADVAVAAILHFGDFSELGPLEDHELLSVAR